MTHGKRKVSSQVYDAFAFAAQINTNKGNHKISLKNHAHDQFVFASFEKAV